MTKRSKVKHVEAKNAKTAATKSAPVAEQKAAPAEPKPKRIKVLKADAKYRGFREQWYNVLKEHDGKTEAEFLEATKAKPPALTRNGTAENPSGWMRFFIREGVASLQQ